MPQLGLAWAYYMYYQTLEERRDVLSLFQQRMYFLRPIKQVSNFAHREVAQVSHQEPTRFRECACPGCAAVELYAFSHPVHLCFSQLQLEPLFLRVKLSRQDTLFQNPNVFRLDSMGHCLFSYGHWGLLGQEAQPCYMHKSRLNTTSKEAMDSLGRRSPSVTKGSNDQQKKKFYFI